jgi:hypothetical protein
MGELFLMHSWILAVIILWSIPWKGIALWKSARNGHLGWFIVLIVVNSLAILDILYIFIFSKIGVEKPPIEKQPNMNLPVKIIPDPVRKNNIV